MGITPVFPLKKSNVSASESRSPERDDIAISLTAYISDLDCGITVAIFLIYVFSNFLLNGADIVMLVMDILTEINTESLMLTIIGSAYGRIAMSLYCCTYRFPERRIFSGI